MTKRLVLLVEDLVDAQELVRLFIMDFCELRSVSSVGDAKTILRDFTPELILMDINLGSTLNGLDLTQDLRAEERFAKTPIIALTAYAMRGDREIALRAGCTDYLTKPFYETRTPRRGSPKFGHRSPRVARLVDQFRHILAFFDIF